MFNIKISNFPKLVEIDKEIKELSKLYEFYSFFKSTYDEWCKKPWEKTESKVLEEGYKTFKKRVRDLGKTYESHPVYEKIDKRVNEFRRSLMQIKILKEHTFFKIEHWDRLLKSINHPTDGIDFSSITLEQVFNFNLQDYSEEVAEVVNAAKTEHNNRTDLNKVEEFWKSAQLKVNEFKKTFTIKVDEELKEKLDEDMNKL